MTPSMPDMPLRADHMDQTRGRVGPDHPFAAIVERAYRVFDRPRPTSDHACDCCMLPAIKRDFLNRDARDLPFGYYMEWGNAAIDPDLPQDFWAWLLPARWRRWRAGRN